jgi:predicted Rossmann fold nucleotide-binding protein DprA/Smf involved in DNA uptake
MYFAPKFSKTFRPIESVAPFAESKIKVMPFKADFVSSPKTCVIQSTLSDSALYSVIFPLALDGILSYLNGVNEIQQIGIFDVPDEIPAKKIEVSPAEKDIVSLLNAAPLSVQDLSEKSGMDVGELCETLFDLEMREIICQTADGKYLVSR